MSKTGDLVVVIDCYIETSMKSFLIEDIFWPYGCERVTHTETCIVNKFLRISGYGDYSNHPHSLS